MAPVSLALTLLIAGFGVQAGNPVWESTVKLQAPHPVEQLAVDVAGYAIRDNATHAQAMAKRYVAMRPQAGPGKAKLWPDKTISYCYATEEARTILYDYLLAATREWQRKGLFRDVYKYSEVADPGASCTGNSQREKILVISYNNLGLLSTTLGQPSLDDNDEDYKGPNMALSERNDVGMLDVVSNIAHELGHAWGLTHEHQNPYFWAPPLGYGSFANSPFNEDTFNCEALKDYEEIHRKVQVDAPSEVWLLCSNRRVASRHGFSAAEFLPILEDMQFEVTDHNAGYGGVDWDSLMIYPSGAGGKGSAAPPAAGQDQDANDHRENVLLRKDGQKIKAHFEPSDRDVQGIRKLYEDSSFPEGQPVLPNNPKSKWYSKLTGKFKKDKCKK
ncbi:hypothetical protein CI238_12142 [Colletotrichum incanum]|uniref:Uncharacterized protein n=1 Tax=Colletotrichum incanum TaxID=1573173 RepID=A0A166T4M5_COLIC|nr:hypothetical protein CI238_12142 [Colletotrichum incanum]